MTYVEDGCSLYCSGASYDLRSCFGSCPRSIAVSTSPAPKMDSPDDLDFQAALDMEQGMMAETEFYEAELARASEAAFLEEPISGFGELSTPARQPLDRRPQADRDMDTPPLIPVKRRRLVSKTHDPQWTGPRSPSVASEAIASRNDDIEDILAEPFASLDLDEDLLGEGDAESPGKPVQYRRFYGFFWRWIRRQRNLSGSLHRLKTLKQHGNLRKLSADQKAVCVKDWAEKDDLAPAEIKTWAMETFERKKNDVAGVAKWLDQTSVLLTWNGDWGCFRLEEALGRDEVLEYPQLSEVCSALASHPRVASLKKSFEDLCEDLTANYFFQDFAFSFEVCTTTFEEGELAWRESREGAGAEPVAGEPSLENLSEPVAGKPSLPVRPEAGTPVRLHVHAFFRSGSRIRAQRPYDWYFLGSCPIKSSTQVVGSKRRTSNMGLYYLQCPKIGSVLAAGNTVPFSSYLVNGEWVMNLVQQGKMDPDTARKEIIRTAKNLPRLLQGLDRYIKEREDLIMLDEIRRTMEELKKQTVPFRVLPAVNEWKNSFETLQFRYKFLVLEGPSKMGKTEFCKSLSPCLLEVDCSNAESPDLKEYQPKQHTAVLFDEASAKMVIRYKKLFQSGAFWVTCCGSSTNMFSYKVWVHRKMLIVSSNKWSFEVDAMPKTDADWLSANSVVVKVDSPLFDLQTAS